MLDKFKDLSALEYGAIAALVWVAGLFMFLLRWTLKTILHTHEKTVEAFNKNTDALHGLEKQQVRGEEKDVQMIQALKDLQQEIRRDK